MGLCEILKDTYVIEINKVNPYRATETTWITHKLIMTLIISLTDTGFMIKICRYIQQS